MVHEPGEATGALVERLAPVGPQALGHGPQAGLQVGQQVGLVAVLGLGRALLGRLPAAARPGRPVDAARVLAPRGQDLLSQLVQRLVRRLPGFLHRRDGHIRVGGIRAGEGTGVLVAKWGSNLLVLDVPLQRHVPLLLRAELVLQDPAVLLARAHRDRDLGPRARARRRLLLAPSGQLTPIRRRRLLILLIVRAGATCVICFLVAIEVVKMTTLVLIIYNTQIGEQR